MTTLTLWVYDPITFLKNPEIATAFALARPEQDMTNLNWVKVGDFKPRFPKGLTEKCIEIAEGRIEQREEEARKELAQTLARLEEARAVLRSIPHIPEEGEEEA